ncbi:MAG: hypothetical protein A3J97_12555 [Spirochaetes bacterium RIFOXYC1_FULL_54_7]|nr:MAG: hypothetical protein A3J97_12555 [Spirochaetes bacterium RIFOXYC1_FULL_54_7]
MHIAMYIFAYATMDVLMGWLKFYIADYLGRPGFLTLGLGSILLTQIFSIPLYIAIANRKGHATAYRVGLGQSAAVLVPFQLLPFVADVDDRVSGTGSFTLL